MATADGTSGRIVQISASRGGVPKLPLPAATVDDHGLTADAQGDRRHHGGPDRALCLFALEVIADLQAQGHSLAPGSTGENITTAGLDWRRIVPGGRLRLGPDVLIEITDYTAPCWKNAQWFSDGDFNRINHKVNPGRSRVYARVLQGGPIRPNDPVQLIEEDTAARSARRQAPTVRWPQDFPAD